jgi:Flavin reductase like domain
LSIGTDLAPRQRRGGLELASHQSEVASLFSREGREKTERTQFAHGRALHVPLIADALAQIESLTAQILLSADHAIIVGVVEEAHIRSGEPLLYFAGRYGSFTPISSPPEIHQLRIPSHDPHGRIAALVEVQATNPY